MKLHTVTGSPNGRKAEAVIDHLGLDVSIVRHEPTALRSPEFRALNRNGMVPVLEDGSFVLWESNAIMQYLADKAGDEALFPRDPQARADVVRWQCWELAHFNNAFGALAFELNVKEVLGLGPVDEGLVARALADLERFAPVLEAHVETRSTLVGDTITIADYSVLAFEGYRAKVRFDWTRFPATNRYFDRLAALDAWRRPKERADALRVARAA